MAAPLRRRPLAILAPPLAIRRRPPSSSSSHPTTSSFLPPPPEALPCPRPRLSSQPPPSSASDRPFFRATAHRWPPSREDPSADPNKVRLGKSLFPLDPFFSPLPFSSPLPPPPSPPPPADRPPPALRILQDRLPTLLQSPLPQEILAPTITLQLFPTTHPHLPAVSGRVAYAAALWTSPIAWNRVPIIGNVKLEILAERMTSEPLTFLPRHPAAIPEQLIVRWCEKRKQTEAGPHPGPITRTLWRGRGVDANKAFTGLFIFDFDAHGRILTHTIEQAEAGGDWGKGMGAKFVGLTDWLLGGMRSPDDTPLPMFEAMPPRRRP